jgi:hypothetical protein
VSRHVRLLTLASPPPPPPPAGGQGRWTARCARLNPTPPPTEGSRRVCTEQVVYTQPCPPASPSGVPGRLSRRVGLQQLNTPPPCTPSHTAPSWADVARWEIYTSTYQEAPAASIADAIALYKRYVSIGLQARFSVRSYACYEEICLSCRFLEPPATRSRNPTWHRHRRRNRHRNRGKPDTRTVSAQTEPSVCATPPRLDRRASPSPLEQATSTAPPPAQSSSPSAPPPAKKTRKRRCEVQLLQTTDDDATQSLCISPPTFQPDTCTRSPSPSPRPRSPMPLLPLTAQSPSTPPSSKPLAPTPPQATSSSSRPAPPSPVSPPSPESPPSTITGVTTIAEIHCTRAGTRVGTRVSRTGTAADAASWCTFGTTPDRTCGFKNPSSATFFSSPPLVPGFRTRTNRGMCNIVLFKDKSVYFYPCILHP